MSLVVFTVHRFYVLMDNLIKENNSIFKEGFSLDSNEYLYGKILFDMWDYSTNTKKDMNNSAD